jgi:predicted O-linked N-acetylglucosamine transferase (SPINDLY family)
VNDPLDPLLELVKNGRYAQARPGLQRLVARKPDNTDARLALADCLLWTGETAAAVFQLERILQTPSLPDELFVPACDLLARAGRSNTAIERLQARRAAEPGSLMTRLSLATLHLSLAQIDQSWEALAEAEAIFPDSPIVKRLKGAVLSKRGDVDGAIDAYRACLWDAPDDINLVSAMAFLLNSSVRATVAEVFQAHRKFGELMAGEVASDGFDFGGEGRYDPARRLRLAFLTHDAVGHSISSFLEEPLRHLDRGRFEVLLYHTGVGHDEVTDRLARCCDRFAHLPAVNSPDLAARIFGDRVDILVELNGHTQGHRLHAMQLRPAPLQATWLGYPNTTGLRTVDIRIVDAITDPPGSERFATERLVRIAPCFICYTPIDTVPERIGAGWKAPVRTTADGRPVFCCFNAAHKVNDYTLALWARVLARVPGSTLLLKSRGVSGPAGTDGLLKRLTAHGVPADRARIIPYGQGNADHLRTYAEADVQLDTFPYHGTTTTCESLLMGVPVVTLTGERHVSRVTTSILNTVGLPHLAATTEEGFVEAAATLASDTPALRRLQAALPAAVRASPLCDGPAFGARMGDALAEQWRLLCAAQGTR